MKLTEEEFQFCLKHKDLIVKIVRTASAAYISPDYREGLIEIGKKYKIMGCTVCNTALYLGTQRLYAMFEEDRVEREKAAAIKQDDPGEVKEQDNINNKEEKKAAPKRKRNTIKK